MRQDDEPPAVRGAIDVPPGLSEAVELAVAAEQRAAITSEPAALTALVLSWQSITRDPGFDAAPPEFRAAAHNTLGAAFERRYSAEGSPGDLDAAISSFTEGVTAASISAPSRPGYVSNLASGLRGRYERGGDITDLESAIAGFEEAVRTTPVGSPDRPMYLGSLGNGLKSRYERGGQDADLVAAVDAYREAVSTAVADDPNRPIMLLNLGTGLRAAYERDGRIADLEASIASYEQALNVTPDGAPYRSAILNNLAGSLGERFARNGTPADLDAAIAATQESIYSTSPHAASLAGRLANLGTGLGERYARDGALADLEAAIVAYQRALAATPPNAPDRAGYMRHVGSSLLQRFDRTRASADLEAAIAIHREALKVSPVGSEDRPAVLLDLGIALNTRYEYSGPPADLDEGIAVMTEALAAMPAGAPSRPLYLGNLAVSLRNRYKRTGAADDLEGAISASRQVLDDLPRDSPNRAGYLANLGDYLRYRYVLTGSKADRDAGTEAYREACQLGLTIAPAVTLSSAQAWGGWAGEREAWAEAAEAYGYGLAAIDGLYRTQLLPGAKQTWLGDAQGMAGQAAFALARTGDLAGAVLALERGRARLLTEAIERDRADLAEVATLDPAAYAAYVQAAGQLRGVERQERAGGIGRPEAMSSVPPDVLQDQARQARAALEAAIGQIQQLPGHAIFGQPPTFDEVAAVAEPGWALVALITTAAGSVALLMSRVDDAAAPTIEAIWAPDLTTAVLNDLLTTVEDDQVVGGYLAGQLGQPDWLEAALAESLPKIGTSLVGPVAVRLRELNATGVVLLPTGLLGLLPLHAAPYPVDGERRCLLDEFDVSHTPGARVLSAARTALAAREAQPAVLVGVGNPQPHPQPLAFARAELEEVARFFPDGASHPLYETAATETALVALLPQATHVHLACHGRFDADAPLDSCLELARPDASEPAGDEGRLRLEEILAGDWFGHTRLVVLSACQTAITDARRLPDEAIGLPAGLLQAGVPGVIGTLWSVDDLSTTLLMTQFYAYHRQGDPTTGDGPLPPAAALRRAQAWLKTRTADDLVAVFEAHRSMAAAAEERRGTRMSAAEAGVGVRQLGLEDPASRPFADPYYWAPFVAIGA